MTPDLNASSAAVLSWLLTYAIHSTILLGAAMAIAAWFADEHAWLDLVWKTALLGPLVTASVQVGAQVIPLGGRWHIATAAEASGAPAIPLAPRDETASEPEKTVDVPSSTAADRGSLSAQPAPPATTSTGASHRVTPAWPVISVLSWLLIATIGLVRFAALVFRLHRALGSGPPVHAPHLHQTLQALGGTTGGRWPIRLTTSRTCVVPLALVGRQIVLPERFLRELDAEQQRAALAHEIAHVVRRDPAWRIVAATLSRAFFFQPLNSVARCETLRLRRVSVRSVGRAADAFAACPGPLPRRRGVLGLAGRRQVGGWREYDGPQRFSTGSPRDTNPERASASSPPTVGCLAGASTARRRDGRAASDRRAAALSGRCGSRLRNPRTGHRSPGRPRPEAGAVSPTLLDRNRA